MHVAVWKAFENRSHDDGLLLLIIIIFFFFFVVNWGGGWDRGDFFVGFR